jgi:hypothetical protein
MPPIPISTDIGAVVVVEAVFMGPRLNPPTKGRSSRNIIS